jgi:hypothetical protein
MNFGLTPNEYLAMVVEAWEEFKLNSLSKRHLISVCTFANHLPEIVVSEYATSDPLKISNCISGSAYRAQIISLCPDAQIVRDLCDYGKHGPVLDRRSVQVQNTGAKEVVVGNVLGISVFGFPIGQRLEKLVVTLRDGTERTADSVIAGVVGFWQQKFVSDDL